MTARKKGKAKEAEGTLDPKAIEAQDTDGAPVCRVVMSDIPERKSAEEAPRESEERFKAMVENAFEGTAIISKEGVTLYESATVERIAGLTVDEAVGTNFFDKVHPDDMDQVVQDMARLVSKPGSKVSSICRIKLPDGLYHYIEYTSTNLIDNPSVGGIVVNFRDITEGKRAEEALKKSEEHYRVLYESSRDALMTLSPLSWQFTSGNQATIALFGARDEADFVSHSPSQYSPERQPDGRASNEKSKKMIEKAMREGSHFFEWIYRNLSGEEFPASVLLTRIEVKGQLLLQATVRNEIDRKRAEEMLRESE